MNSTLASSLDRQQSNRTLPLILAVDDDDDNLLLIRYAIELFGCQFVGQSSCHAAHSIIQESRPDLILLDILLPDLDGYTFVQSLRQDPLTSDTPVIAVTALARAEDRETILLSGFTDYLSKPFMLEDLEALIHRYLG